MTMPVERMAAFLRRDAEVWTPFLTRCDGFLGKEVWLPDDRPGTVVLVIRWASMEQWKAIPPEQLEAVDAAMGALAPDRLDGRSYSLWEPSFSSGDGSATS